MHESLPGGLDALKDLIDQFHARDVRVLLPLNPWDHGTNDSGLADYEALISLIQRVGADGFNGDTMNGVNASYWDEALPEYPIMIEPETMASSSAYGPDDTDLETNLWSWGYWQYDQVPSVSAYKALTGGKHLTHICERWAMDHTDGIQHAFYKGAGFESWENVWGIWNGITERNAALLERASSILRALGDLFQGGDPDFIPHIPVTPEKSMVYSTLFQNETHKVFLFTNRNAFDAKPLELSLPCRFSSSSSSSSSTPPASLVNYTKIDHTNCYSMHGADDLESPQGTATGVGIILEECSALCTETEGCEAFVFGKVEGSCFRRSDAFDDEHTSRAIIRGGNRWSADGSAWYLPEPRSLNEHDTFLLMSDSMDRSAGIGFRCVSE